MISYYVPAVCFASEEDAAAAKRREIMERLRRGETVTVSPQGQIAVPNLNQPQGSTPSLTVPAGKLA